MFLQSTQNLPEAWNYNHWVDDWGRFAFPELKSYDHFSVELKEVPLQVTALNKLSEEIISKHDPKRWTQLYDDEGMLLYSHSPLYQGKPAIKAHLEEHVKGLVVFNNLDIGNYFLEELDEYIIELGNHQVNWANGGRQGLSKGKNIRIWKKHSDGSIKIFRQTAMYDNPPPLPEQQINSFRKFFGEWTLKDDKWEQSNAQTSKSNSFSSDIVKLYDTKKAPAKAQLNQLAWMEGTWITKMDHIYGQHVILEEQDSQLPSFFRSVHNGKIYFYEITQFVQVGESVSYNVKHFSQDLKGWEKQDESVDRPLVHYEEGIWCFDGISFKKTSEDSFTVYFLIQEGERKGEIREIFFTREKDLKSN